MPRILIFDSSKENAEMLEQALHTLLGAVMISLHNPEDVFNVTVSDDTRMAFFTLSSMYDAEAARKFNALHKNIPMVMVSDSSDYGVLSWSLGSCYYLLRPFGENELPRAIHRCAM